MSRGNLQATLLLAAIATAVAAGAVAQAPPGAPAPDAQAAPTAAAMSDGEVRRIDKDAGKITLKHGPIPSLDMPEMTMVFRVKDPALLDQVKAGDKVRFTADKIGGQYTVVSIEKR